MKLRSYAGLCRGYSRDPSLPSFLANRKQEAAFLGLGSSGLRFSVQSVGVLYSEVVPTCSVCPIIIVLIAIVAIAVIITPKS